MTDCKNLDPYLEDGLEGEALAGFETHKSECSQCQKALANWEAVQLEYTHWMANQEFSRTINHSEATGFVSDVSNKLNGGTVITLSKRQKRQTVKAIAAVAALFILMSAVFLYHSNKHSSVEPAPKMAVEQSATVKIISYSDDEKGDDEKTEQVQKVTHGSQFVAKDKRRLLITLHKDKIGLDGGSTARIVSVTPELTLLELTKGTIACDVNKRKGKEQFAIRVDQMLVTVIGTRFSVSLDELNEVNVTVQEGLVKIKRGDSQVQLPAGKSVKGRTNFNDILPATDANLQMVSSLLLTEVTQPIKSDYSNNTVVEEPTPLTSKNANSADNSPKAFTPKKEMQAWKELIIQKKLGQAALQIKGYLKHHPADVETLMLLATCQRKQGQLKNAISSYEKVMTSKPTSIANQARFLAGEISQTQLNDYGRAIRYFNGYLANTPQTTPSRAEASLRLAQSHLELGQKAKAKTVLEKVVDQYGRTSVGNRARKLLEDKF